MPPSIDDQLRTLSRRTERMISDADLRSKLERSAKSGKPLRIKLGMDPTAADVTLGHAVPLRVIRQFQEWGHKAVLIIGDYTARLGDVGGDRSGVDAVRQRPRPLDVAADLLPVAGTWVGV